MGLLNHETNPISSLIAAFTAWKGLLLAIALGASVGPDYDTSTSLFFNIVHGPATPVPALATRLTRWDALYFMHDAVKGKVYEQEWAFGIGLPAVVRGINELFGLEGWDAIIAIAISHVSHIIAVLSLYQLTIVLCNDRKLAYLAAAVHILSPGGLFLSAPYAESTFACLSFVGNLLFALSLKASPDSLRRNISVIGAGLLYGVSCIFRSNGLFGGVLFAVEAIKGLTALLGGFTFSKALRLVAPIIGGLFVAVGFVAPQILAWMRNVGFLRYWTPNQIPLFLLAAPMLTILIKSGTEVMREPSRGLRAMISGTDEQCRVLVRTLASVQTLLAVLAITNYHVQIISRISSAYPVWYWWVASCLMDRQRQNLGYGIIMFISMYAMIQGGLFASFLPPA
ncbi:GPI mannosyltransferase 2 [Fusarium oxysporum]|uniref:GPI mannosyltransferase 2 n=1 Tax=Fusarium oxysporum TaxID=5507 RepID=A0A420RD89_FUSOX|nr:GPI mannosyltransferase 2 [Fusarium oxysporum]